MSAFAHLPTLEEAATTIANIFEPIWEFKLGLIVFLVVVALNTTARGRYTACRFAPPSWLSRR